MYRERGKETNEMVPRRNPCTKSVWWSVLDVSMNREAIWLENSVSVYGRFHHTVCLCTVGLRVNKSHTVPGMKLYSK